MKKTYEEVEIEVIAMNSSDVVITSAGTGEEFSIDLDEE
jgi:hypothetical protein